MTRILIIAIIIFSGISLNAQPTIEIFLTNHPFLSRGSVIESVEDTYELLVNNVQPKPYKNAMLFNSQGFLIAETSYGKAGGKMSETKYDYNQNNRLTKKTQKYFVNMLGWKVDETALTYNDTTGFISEIRFIKNGVLQTTSKVFCDKVGLPFEVRVLDDKGAFISIEKISYSPNSNITRVMILKTTNQLVSRWLYAIDYTKPYQAGSVEKEYNSNGDVVLESLDYQTKTDQGYFYDYSYDGQGNWIEKNTYQVTFNKNNKVKDKKLEHKISRIIKYF